MNSQKKIENELKKYDNRLQKYMKLVKRNNIKRMFSVLYQENIHEKR